MGANRTSPAWTQDELRKLDEAIRELGVGAWGRIAKRVGTRTAGACSMRHYNSRPLRGDVGAIERKAPANVIAERDRARNAASYSITADFFGDPLPGRSALDRKLRGESDLRRFANPFMSSASLTTTRPLAPITLYWGKNSSSGVHA